MQIEIGWKIFFLVVTSEIILFAGVHSILDSLKQMLRDYLATKKIPDYIQN